MPFDSAQQQVDRYFQSSVAYWNDIYFDTRLLPTIYRERQRTAIEWIRQLRLRTSARVLEVGCGAGFMSIALARENYRVDTIDSTMAMIELARQHAAQAGVSERIRLLVGDAHALSAADKTYDLVVALGVIPWLHTERQAVFEMTRVLKPGGYLLVTADNDARLNRLIDPLSTPVFKPLRKAAKTILNAKSQNSVETASFVPKRHYPRQVDRLLRSCGLQCLEATTVGFGVLTVAGRQILPNAAAVWLHHRLQYLARYRIFPFSLTGMHYIVLAQK